MPRFFSLCLSILLLLTWCATLRPAAAAPAAERSGIASLSDGWEYRWGDSPKDAGGTPEWATLDAGSPGWTPMAALAQPADRDGNKYLWIRLPLPAGSYRDPAVFLGTVAHAFDAYVAGRRVYRFGIDEAGEHFAPLGWHLVPLQPGDLGHELYLRIYSGNPWIVGVQKAARVGERSALVAHLVSEGLGPLLVGAISLALAAVAALGAFGRKGGRAFALLAAFSASAGLVLVANGSLQRLAWDSLAGWNWLFSFGAYMLPPSLLGFVNEVFLGGRVPFVRRFAKVVLAIALVLTVAISADLASTPWTMLPFVLVLLASLATVVVVVLLEVRRGNPEAKVFLGGATLLLAFAAADALSLLAVANIRGSFAHWGLLAFIGSMGLILLRRVVAMNERITADARHIERKNKQLEELSGELREAVRKLVVFVGGMRASGDRQAQTMTRQSAALEETRQTARALRETSTLAAEQAQAFLGAMHQVDEVGRSGAETVVRSLQELGEIQSEVSAMAGRIQAVHERARQVERVVEVVKSLASQSNMLALNAAIEAVRSADQGKGFAVVARQMRALADQSLASTTQIKRILGDLQQEIGDAAEGNSRGEARIRESAQSVRASGEHLRKLAELVRENGSLVRGIGAAVSTQSEGFSQVFEAINSVSEMMRDTLERLEETAAATGAVEELAGRMAAAGEGVEPEEVVEPQRAAG